MVQFVRLRLSGFKSFVDPTELLIESGTTGIVGPNGCGKSNLVEALRWVMGETSAKRLRGGEMDDVIFGGSSNRPPRNLAEVGLSLDNHDRTAPANLNDQDELEIIRQIERDKGSTYRVNGREVRARDVQLLFADAASGAQSTAIVSQGRVGALINAKPADRRMLLEEAAGISGLHSRRHEAELRLKAAEANLERLDDVAGTMESQLQSLKKQARQATRYRNLADQLRRQEALLLHLEWLEARAHQERAREALKAAKETVDGLTQQAATAAREQAQAANALPELRQQEAEASAALRRLVSERDSLQAEETRIKEARAQAEDRLSQIDSDLKRTANLLEDASEARQRLQDERAQLQEAGEGEQAARDDAIARRDGLSEELSGRQDDIDSQAEAIANDEARRSTLERRLADMEDRARKLEERIALQAGEERDLKAQQPTTDSMEAAARALENAESEAETLQQSLEEITGEISDLRSQRESLAERHRAQAAVCTRLETERNTLTQLLESSAGESGPPLADSLSVERGYEAALGAALGEDLEAPVLQGDNLGKDAPPLFWTTLPDLDRAPALPQGCTPLTQYVGGSPALARRLSQTGLVETAEQAGRLQASLQPGQRLVTPDGDLWRWDGYTAYAEAPTASAQRLAQRNRLSELEGELDEAERARKTIEAEDESLRERLQAAEAREKDSRLALKSNQEKLDSAREAQARLERETAAISSKLEAVAESIANLETEKAELNADLEAVRQEQADLPDTTAARARLEEARQELGDLRRQHNEADAELGRLTREARERSARLEAIGREEATWERRTAESDQHRKELETRREAVRQELDSLSARPEEITAQHAALAEKIAEAEEAQRKAADALAQGETRQREADSALKQAEQAVAEARETRVRAEASVEQAEQALDAHARRVREQLDCVPDALLEQAGLMPDQDLPERDEVAAKVERLRGERERMGPVNLRADTEAEELSQQIEEIAREREDLTAAIARLRQGISSLNREGRERLLAAFEQVNRHFTQLFTRLFGGGEAHLRLTEAEDPLDAGLEIMASPPGKRLQVMSLLSGGEQALTALAVLFAVFLTNPAPVCILDEVDAPLDDSNVDRFCDLVDELAHSLQTRFLLVTHHRLTMARVDRLFGVTMSERGVSQLVSVDMEEAEALRETA
ncbi:chromosome segregation protein SMC [Fodinicurvata fenggangensis]|uniref:chromosome segregation protein SMC n=1 Tax=Fodinicurvata fenggangensis TaxID=1121830 RepID=UPI00047EE47B|nr:chromosome segregation protein SMC [Fodinicurvata fenggangensis]